MAGILSSKWAAVGITETVTQFVAKNLYVRAGIVYRIRRQPALVLFTNLTFGVKF